MTKKELSKVLKPLIKECVKEVIFEDGGLSKIISEVFTGLTSTNSEQLMEANETRPPARQLPTQNAVKLSETKRRVLDAIGAEAYSGVDLFEGTTPLSTSGTPGSPTAPQSPLSGIDPSDKGVDIAKMFPEVPSIWKKLI